MRPRPIVFGACASVAAMATLTIGVAPASGDDGARRVAFTTNAPFTPADFQRVYTGDQSRCTITPALNFAAPCVTPVRVSTGFDSTISGDLVGTAPSGESAVLGVGIDISPTSLDYPYVTYAKVSATVARCGAGAFIIRTEGNLNSPAFMWEIVKNTGRGDLTSISGRGTAAASFDGPGGTQLVRYVGKIRCDRHGHASD